MTKFKVNKSLLPIKAHYFFFMAALGPILPQLSVYGKELGISPDVMGLITSILPILYILAKPICGYLIDYFTNIRKLIFMIIILIMILCFSGLIFVPKFKHNVAKQNIYNFSTVEVQQCVIFYENELCENFRQVNCVRVCSNVQNDEINNIYTGYIGKMTENLTQNNIELCLKDYSPQNLIIDNQMCIIRCSLNNINSSDCLYKSKTFWIFVILMCLGTIGFNVTNCISDAICFDILGDTQTMKYGAQRVWGTVGFGVTALLGGIAVNATTNDTLKSITPAIVIMLIFCSFDIVSIKWLKLPNLSGSETIIRDVGNLLKRKEILIFLIFATFAGILDSFIIYYMFWYLEEIANATNYMGSIKLIEGCVVAAECLGGEILFFLISGKILKKIGYVHCLSFCFFMYSIRFGLISLITNPWWLVGIELFMQGPTYALCYTCIVAYASAVSPVGTTGTVQGLVAGMDDGVGFAIGSLIGGQMYKHLGGKMSFRIFSVAALVTCFTHIILRPRIQREAYTEPVLVEATPSELSKLNETRNQPIEI